MNFLFSIFLFIFCFTIPISLVSSLNGLKHFEILDSFSLIGNSHLQNRHRRDADLHPDFSINSKGLIELEIQLFGEKYTLLLHHEPGSIISSDFHAFTVLQNGTRVPLEIDMSQISYTGSVRGYPGSRVNAHFEDGKLFARIELFGSDSPAHELIYVEPAWRYFGNSPSNSTLIAYRARDLTDDIWQYLRNDGIRVNETTAQTENEHVHRDGHKQRLRRQAEYQPGSSKTSCSVYLVADYLFCKHIGDGSEARTGQFMLTVMGRVNDYYRRTLFDPNIKESFGFSIKGLEVHCNPSERPEFNQEKSDWNYEDFLYSFSLDNNWDKYCLAHLFTYRSWSSGTLGLGFIASPDVYSVGGVCSKPSYKAGAARYINTAWSSYCDPRGARVLQMQGDVITAHELGHNWGAEHDPDTSECAPGAGHYIMYPHSSTGSQENNLVFSPCSRRTIARVLRSKSGLCFTERVTATCGNGFVESGEECDVGVTSSATADPCCDKTCKLKRSEGAECSFRNDDCCTRQCKFASDDTVCRNASKSFCTQDVKCTGSDARCPPKDVKMPAGTKCALDGKCNQKGVCEPYCQAHHQRPTCACPEKENRCRRCCIDETGLCLPFNLPGDSKPLYLPPGLPCLNGFCEANGTCTVVKKTLVKRVWSFLGNMTISRFWTFVKNNIVGCTVIATLIIWIPAAVLIYCFYDLRQYDELKRQYQEYLAQEQAAETARTRTLEIEAANRPAFYPRS